LDARRELECLTGVVEKNGPDDLLWVDAAGQLRDGLVEPEVHGRGTMGDLMSLRPGGGPVG